jgi:hypothetical protein
MQADPWWSCAMAVNVFLVFFNNADPQKFRQYKWVYCVVCFGGPMMLAVILVSIRNEKRGLGYGDAAVSTNAEPALAMMLTEPSCGVGSNLIGVLSDFGHTISPSGFVLLSVSSSTSR